MVFQNVSGWLVDLPEDFFDNYEEQQAARRAESEFFINKLREIKRKRGAVKRVSNIRSTPKPSKFKQHIEDCPKELKAIYTGATWRESGLTGGKAATLKKYGIIVVTKTSPGRWVTTLTPEAILYLKLEGAEHE